MGHAREEPDSAQNIVIRDLRAIKLNVQCTKRFCLSNTYLTNPPLSQRARVSHSSILLPWLWVSSEVAQLYCGAKTARHHLSPLGKEGVVGGLWRSPSCSGLYPLGSWNSKDGDPSPFGQRVSSSAESSSQWKYCLRCSQYPSSFSSGPLFPLPALENRAWHYLSSNILLDTLQIFPSST